VAEGQECHARPRIGGVNALPMIGLGLADAVAGLLCFPLVSLSLPSYLIPENPIHPLHCCRLAAGRMGKGRQSSILHAVIA